jgi:hypothetical protein
VPTATPVPGCTAHLRIRAVRWRRALPSRLIFRCNTVVTAAATQQPS